MAEGFLALGSLDSARAASDRLLELVPRNPRALSLATRVAIAQGDHAAADAYLRTAIEVADTPELRVALAENLSRWGKPDEAEAELAKLPPELMATESIHMLRGNVMLRRGDLEGARRQYAAAFEATPTSRSAIALSAILWRLEEREAAVKRLTEWLAETPDDGRALNQLASYHSAMGADDDAAAAYERLLALYPDNAVTLNNLAWHYRSTDIRRALDYVDRALAKAPGSPNILDTKAMILLEAGRREAALRSIDEALSKAADNPLFLVHRAVILAAMGRSSEARAIVNDLPATGTVQYMADLAEARKSLGEDS
jgi:Flp pilus assembly protein TadD